MIHGRAVYSSLLHHSSWKVYLPLDFVNYLFTQPIWLGVSWAQYEKFAHKVSYKKGYMTEWIRTMIVATNGSGIGSIKPLILPNPAAQKWSTSSPEAELQRKLHTLNFWICPSMFHGTPTYTFRKSLERVMELLRSKYVPIPGSSWQFSWKKYDVLTTNSQWIVLIAIVNS